MFHNFDHDLELAYKKLEEANPESKDEANPESKSEILPENYKILKRRIKQLHKDDRKPRTIINNIVILIRFSKWCKKSSTRAY